MGHPNWVGAGGVHGEKIHLRQNKRDTNLLNTPQGSIGRTAKERVLLDGGEAPQL